MSKKSRRPDAMAGLEDHLRAKGIEFTVRQSKLLLPATEELAKPSKFGNVWTAVDGIKFQSKHEARRYGALKLEEQNGLISDLSLQVEFELRVNDMHICNYRADFVYMEKGERIIEDAKGYRTTEYKIKKKLMLACLGIAIRET